MVLVFNVLNILYLWRTPRRMPYGLYVPVETMTQKAKAPSHTQAASTTTT
jgi:hypothetical protein